MADGPQAGPGGGEGGGGMSTFQWTMSVTAAAAFVTWTAILGIRVGQAIGGMFG